MTFYVDTSALVKLVTREAETAPFQLWSANQRDNLASCDLARTELLRAARRAAIEPARIHQVLTAITLMRLSTAVFEHAGQLDPVALRSLDAVHLAAALILGDDLEGIVTYDTRLADAARAHGVPVVAPT